MPASAAMLLAAPVRFSIRNGWPSRSERTRAAWSNSTRRRARPSRPDRPHTRRDRAPYKRLRAAPSAFSGKDRRRRAPETTRSDRVRLRTIPTCGNRLCEVLDGPPPEYPQSRPAPAPVRTLTGATVSRLISYFCGVVAAALRRCARPGRQTIRARGTVRSPRAQPSVVTPMATVGTVDQYRNHVPCGDRIRPSAAERIGVA